MEVVHVLQFAFLFSVVNSGVQNKAAFRDAAVPLRLATTPVQTRMVQSPLSGSFRMTKRDFFISFKEYGTHPIVLILFHWLSRYSH